MPGCPRCARQGCGGSNGACSPQPHVPTGSRLPERDRDPRLRCPTGTFQPGPDRAMCCGVSCPRPAGVSWAKGLAAAHSPHPATCNAAGRHGARRVSPAPTATHPSPARPKHGGKEGKKLQVCFLKALGKNVALDGARPKPTGLGSLTQPRAREPRQLLQDVG